MSQGQLNPVRSKTFICPPTAPDIVPRAPFALPCFFSRARCGPNQTSKNSKLGSGLLIKLSGSQLFSPSGFVIELSSLLRAEFKSRLQTNFTILAHSLF